MSEELAIEIHDLSVSYDRKPVLYGVDVEIPQGQLVGIMGPNGAGKSTLIKAVMGLLPAQSGWIKLLGGEASKQWKRVAYVPQRGEVDWDFPVSVMDVAMMGTYGKLRWWQRPGERERELARQCLDQLGILPLANRPIGDLSGGQQQRVFLARALAQDAELYLMDEPFTGVDAATEKAIIELLRALRERGKTVLVVHHDLQTVPEYFDHLILLNMRVIAYGATADTFTVEKLQETYGGRLTILSEVANRTVTHS